MMYVLHAFHAVNSKMDIAEIKECEDDEDKNAYESPQNTCM